ncbi:histone acetyltransferase type B catalytic subunit [Thrips palmi]|uniref:Histone acetyltransferase type B catalytic subunit n=1 Tax=Thrips palmi TaxID=161013 RepID=A0A6P8ZVI2_THRPL|nr:histone acetyltransferase type B catalytic subunit [Thrips palmi]
MDIAGDCSEAFLVDSNSALEFKLVRHADDLKDEKTTFRPEMSHQVFGENERIFGYRDLKVKLYYTAGRLNTYLGIDFKETADPDDFDGVEPDDIMRIVAEKIPPGFMVNLDTFLESLNKESSFKPHGELVHSFKTERDGKAPSTCEIYYCETSNADFIKYHSRLQTFVLWYIDASSYIDTDDDNWRFFTCYEKYERDGNTLYAIAGYATVYDYYAYPENKRPRISQFLVLPPFQRQGIGANLLRTIYNRYMGNAKVLDITVEDPSQDFQFLRDYVDCENLKQLSCYQPDALKRGFCPNEMALEAREKFKINKKQARRVYEILRLRATNRSDSEEYRQYRLDVKKRLNTPFQKENLMLEKLQKVLSEDELKATALNLKDKSQRLESLDRQYKDLEEEFLHVIERMAASSS